MRGKLRYLVAAALIIAFPLLVKNAFWIHIGQTIAFTTIVVIGLNLLLGLSGQLSLGQAGFYAIGAYGSAIVAATCGYPLWVSIPAGISAALLAGVVVGFVALRTRALYLAMATLAFGFIVEILAQRWVTLTGGTMGIFGVPQLHFGDPAWGNTSFFWVVLGVLLFVQLVNDYIMGSFWGRNLQAIRESESFARTVGLNVALWRSAIFAGSAVLAGVGGLFFAHQNGYVSSDAFNLSMSLNFLIAVVIGGLGHPYGPVVGAAVMALIGEAIAGLYHFSLLLYGLILFTVMLLLPEGLVGLFARVKGLFRKGEEPPGEITEDPQQDDTVIAGLSRGEGGRSREAVLEICGVTKSYAGLMAVGDVSLTVKRGTIHALIGPNGAGKSTLINVISGLYTADAGTLKLFGGDVTRMPAHRRVRLGIARTFQNLQLINSLSVLENVMLGFQENRPGFLAGFAKWLFTSRYEAEERDKALAILRFFGISRLADRMPGDLPYGHRKLCELARAVAQRPAFMLLDEPISGLNEQEVCEISRVVVRLRDAGITILVVEHNMDFVMSICDYVTVLDYGRKIAEGKPDEIRNDQKVIDAYLGVEQPV